MSPIPPHQNRSFLFLPTTWSKIVICLTIFSTAFVIFFVGKEIVTLAQAPVTGILAHAPAASNMPSAAPSAAEADPRPAASTPLVVGMRSPAALEDPTHSTPLPAPLASNPVDFRTMSLHTLASKRNYVYTFEGIATYRHVPCANAIVIARVTAGDQTQTAAGFTSTDGSYAVSVPIIASANENVDWMVEARTAEMKKAESIGRRIATEDTTEQITLQTSLALLPQ